MDMPGRLYAKSLNASIQRALTASKLRGSHLHQPKPFRPRSISAACVRRQEGAPSSRDDIEEVKTPEKAGDDYEAQEPEQDEPVPYSSTQSAVQDDPVSSNTDGASRRTRYRGRPHLPFRLRQRIRNRPYSIPEADKWMQFRKSQLPNIVRSGLAKVKPAAWTAHMATKPLLLTLDAFDTLFTPRKPVPVQYCAVAKEFGFDLKEEEVAASFKEAFTAISKQHPNYGKESGMEPRSWWAEVIKQTMNRMLPDGEEVPEELVEKLYLQFSSKAGYKLFPDVEPFLRLIGTSYNASRWPPRRTMLGIISNSDPRVRTILESLRIDIVPSLFPPRYAPHSRKFNPKFGVASFAFATLSYETGNAKPSHAIFADADQDAQFAMDHVHNVGRLTRSGNSLLDNIHREFHHMHVGDELEKDVIPALDCGWDAVLLDRSIEMPLEIRDIDGRQITVIRDLMSLRELVTRERLEADGGQKPVWIPEGTSIKRTEVPFLKMHGRYILSRDRYGEGYFA